MKSCPDCGGLYADKGPEMIAGRLCMCGMDHSTTAKLKAAMRRTLELVGRVRDHDPHPSHCDHIHEHCTEAIKVLEDALSEND